VVPELSPRRDGGLGNPKDEIATMAYELRSDFQHIESEGADVQGTPPDMKQLVHQHVELKASGIRHANRMQVRRPGLRFFLPYNGNITVMRLRA